jgi:hypothetical protein
MKDEKEEEMVTGDTPPIFGVHTPPIMEKETERNRQRQQKRFFNCQKPIVYKK